MPRWPADPPVDFQAVAQISSEGYFLRRVSLGEHTGTHINAPISFHLGGQSIDALPVQSSVAPAVLFDAARESSDNPDFLLSLEDVVAWESHHGPVPTGSIVLLNTGWQMKWGTPEEFLNLDRAGVGHFPGFGVDAVRYLLEERGIGGIGIDTHGVDGGSDQTYAVNRLMLEQPRVVLENLANLDQLPATGVTLVIGALRLAGGSGSPASVLAFAP
ncbi:MAG: cyclase family protein [Chloroflexi bacterium]|nr:cyclase family protein [Chloroflexota bacterium]MCH8897515.1 cyclase family protein [Chloroflexota bacterium]